MNPELLTFLQSTGALIRSALGLPQIPALLAGLLAGWIIGRSKAVGLGDLARALVFGASLYLIIIALQALVQG